MNLDDATNPAAADDTAQATVTDDAGVDTEGQTAEPQYDDDGNLIEPDEDEEVELDDLKLKVPKDQAQKVREALLRQADYTRKTQEVAELRKAVEAERQNLHQFSQAELDAYADAATLGRQLAQYQQIDWRAWHDSDPFAASAANSEYTMLRDRQQAALAQLSHLAGQRTFQKQQQAAKQMEEGRAVLAREVPGWSDDLKAKLTDYAVSMGGTREDVADIEATPWAAKILHAAFQGSQATGQAKKVQQHLAAQTVQPAAKPGAAKAPVQGVDDRLSADEWMRRRNAQTRKRA